MEINIPYQCIGIALVGYAYISIFEVLYLIYVFCRNYESFVGCL